MKQSAVEQRRLELLVTSGLVSSVLSSLGARTKSSTNPETTAPQPLSETKEAVPSSVMIEGEITPHRERREWIHWRVEYYQLLAKYKKLLEKVK